jgi:hypothetical protein
MEKTNDKRRDYRNYVEAYLVRRHIAKTIATLIWLRSQKEQSRLVKKESYDKVLMEIGVIDEMICEIESEEEK